MIFWECPDLSTPINNVIYKRLARDRNTCGPQMWETRVRYVIVMEDVCITLTVLHGENVDS